MVPNPSIADIGIGFARALVAGQYAKAHTFLTAKLQRELLPADLQAHYEAMVSYTTVPPDTIKVGQIFEPSAADGVPDALGWVFVDIDCLDSPDGCWLERVGVLVVEDGAQRAIDYVEWGRP